MEEQEYADITQLRQVGQADLETNRILSGSVYKSVVALAQFECLSTVIM